ncbi:MAG TPA: 50S ribosomal protein L18 [Armatimonadota bacterium]|nr:50S ribosomal protein L18 [Armatimonadota bacterium]
MGNTSPKLVARRRRHARLRKRVSGTAEKPRLAVFKSLRHVYAQVIDDTAGHTLVAASTLDKDVASSLSGPSGTVSAAAAVGAAVGKRALEKGITEVVFDRGGYPYHGRVAALADAAREAGLRF